MKENMFKYFTANNTRRYIDVLDEMVNQCNNTFQSSIKNDSSSSERKEK